MFQRILLPIDGSDVTARAVTVAIGLAKSLGAELIAFTVIPPLATIDYLARALHGDDARYAATATAHAEAILLEACASARAAGVQASSAFVIDARPWCAIVTTAEQRGCDLIVMASHARNAIERVILGSETHKVILDGRVPVLVC